MRPFAGFTVATAAAPVPPPPVKVTTAFESTCGLLAQFGYGPKECGTSDSSVSLAGMAAARLCTAARPFIGAVARDVPTAAAAGRAVPAVMTATTPATRAVRARRAGRTLRSSGSRFGKRGDDDIASSR